MLFSKSIVAWRKKEKNPKKYWRDFSILKKKLEEEEEKHNNKDDDNKNNYHFDDDYDDDNQNEEEGQEQQKQAKRESAPIFKQKMPENRLALPVLRTSGFDEDALLEQGKFIDLFFFYFYIFLTIF